MNRTFLPMAWSSNVKKASLFWKKFDRMTNPLRVYSTEVRQQEPIIIFVDQKNARSKWHKLFRQDKKYPFPGDVTSKLAYENEEIIKTEMKVEKITLEEVLEKRANPVKRDALNGESDVKAVLKLEAMECPKLLRNDLQELFKGIKLNNNVSILNLTRKTEHDMSVWSMDMELERLQLTAGFVESALKICELLQKDGYWADFIDPSSGRPYLGKYTNATLCNTDERYRSLGFRIIGCGCCKVLEHGSWGRNAFVGTIFTDAPINSAVLVEILGEGRE